MANNTIIRMVANPGGFGESADELAQGDFESALPVQHSHEYFEDEELGLYAGLWDTTSMIETGGAYTCDEFMWLLQGEVEIRNNATGTVDRVGAGEAFIIPRGYDCQWQQNGYLRKFYVIFEPPRLPIPSEPVVAGIVKPRISVQQGENSDTVSYRDSGGQFLVGSWCSGPFESGQAIKPYHQFVYIVQGSLTIVDEWSEMHNFQAGEALFLPRETISSWHVPENVGIHYVKVYTEATPQ